ncbi:DUF4333 domain-containing protein [Mycobacterium hodleri]|uniref:DUF4333 domain-containing protein n=1 Tax=Mycolicibacterium hodleri TaxID=49897 RepID=UPI0021F32B85|nr:DUF4333 domain-containing protein [Mycolicibacterium hodleri]MCV7135239.1 DUF4333 domain-containing protein [Mycolicibacterium hodleri]
MRWTATAALAGAIACGCTGTTGSDLVPTVAKDALQKDVAAKLTTAGERPQSVVCESDLVGEVGRTSHCDVAIGAANGFQPVVTVTGTDGGAIQYDLTPALSREQLEAAVARLVAEKSSERIDSVACGGGLTGEVGASAGCDVVAGGVQEHRTVEVTEVSGLTMKFTLRTN